MCTHYAVKGFRADLSGPITDCPFKDRNSLPPMIVEISPQEDRCELSVVYGETKEFLLRGAIKMWQFKDRRFSTLVIAEELEIAPILISSQVYWIDVVLDSDPKTILSGQAHPSIID